MDTGRDGISVTGQLSEDVSALLRDIYPMLLAHHGPQNWWPADSPFEVIVGAILVQNTAWTNVEKAIRNLRDRDLLSAAALRAVPEADLAETIRPSGYYRMKARKLHAFMEYLSGYDDDLTAVFSRPLPDLRVELLSVYGVGEETADSILLYAGELPSFVVDAYTRRILARVGITSETEPYRETQRRFEEALPVDQRMYNEYHALIVRHAVAVCVKRDPQCDACPLLALCVTGQARGTT